MPPLNLTEQAISRIGEAWLARRSGSSWLKIRLASLAHSAQGTSRHDTIVVMASPTPRHDCRDPALVMRELAFENSWEVDHGSTLALLLVGPRCDPARS